MSRHGTPRPPRRPVPSSIVCGLRTLARSPQLLILHRLACRAQLTDAANGRVGGLFWPARSSSPVRIEGSPRSNRGTIVYISGQVSSDASGKIIGESDFEAQVEQVF